MAERRLIIHADDFGLTKPVNRGILQAFELGLLTSASIMANGAAFDHAVDIARLHPDLDLGIHLTLVEEAPLLPLERVQTLTDNSGRFVDNAATFTRHLMLGRIDLSEVYAELEAQIEKVMGSGLAISHLDSHQHLHMLPGVRGVVFQLARRFGIKAIRLPREPLQRYMLKRPLNPVRLSQMFVLNVLSNLSVRHSLSTTDTFRGFYWGGGLSSPRLREMLESLPPNKSCEVMCHPGLADDSGSYRHWRYNHAEELGALCDGGIRDWLATQDIRLISYRDLSSPV